MSAEANTALIRRMHEEFNHGNDAVAEALYADGCVLHNLIYRPVSLDGTPMPGGDATLTPEQREQGRQERARWGREFPDLRVTVDAQFAADDTVTSVTTTRGVHRTGRVVAWKDVSIHRIADGKVVEVWGLGDRLGYWQQLGLVPETPELLRRAAIRR